MGLRQRHWGRCASHGPHRSGCDLGLRMHALPAARRARKISFCWMRKSVLVRLRHQAQVRPQTACTGSASWPPAPSAAAAARGLMGSGDLARLS